MAKKDDAPAKAELILNDAQIQLLEWLSKPPLAPPGFAFGEHVMRTENERLVEAGYTTPFDPLADGWSGVEVTPAGLAALKAATPEPPPAPEPEPEKPQSSNKSASSTEK